MYFLVSVEVDVVQGCCIVLGMLLLRALMDVRALCCLGVSRLALVGVSGLFVAASFRYGVSKIVLALPLPLTIYPPRSAVGLTFALLPSVHRTWNQVSRGYHFHSRCTFMA